MESESEDDKVVELEAGARNSNGMASMHLDYAGAASHLVTSGFYKHLPSSFMHRRQPGNDGFLEASPIELHASLPTW